MPTITIKLQTYKCTILSTIIIDATDLNPADLSFMLGPPPRTLCENLLTNPPFIYL